MARRSPPPSVLRAFLAGHRVARLATADAAGRPHVVPIVYAVSGDTVYTPIDRKAKRAAPDRLRRVRNIRENPAVAVLVDAYDEDWRRLGFVLAEGRAELLTEGLEYARALDLLRARYPQYRELPLEGGPVIAVRIARLSGWGHLGASDAAIRGDPASES